jgi:hypothetical protein
MENAGQVLRQFPCSRRPGGAVAALACLLLLGGCDHSRTNRTTLEGDLLVKSTPTDPQGNPIGDPELSAADASTQVLLLQGAGVAKVATPANGHFVFRDLVPGQYRICAQLFGTPSDTSQAFDVAPGANQRPAAIVLPDSGIAVSPNPTAGSVRFVFGLPAPRRADLRVYSDTGRLVRLLLALNLPAGIHAVLWDGLDDQNTRVGPGFYLVVLSTSDIVANGGIVTPPPSGMNWGRAHVSLVEVSTGHGRPH